MDLIKNLKDMQDMKAHIMKNMREAFMGMLTEWLPELSAETKQAYINMREEDLMLAAIRMYEDFDDHEQLWRINRIRTEQCEQYLEDMLDEAEMYFAAAADPAPAPAPAPAQNDD
jgi:hypothetical protein